MQEMVRGGYDFAVEQHYDRLAWRFAFRHKELQIKGMTELLDEYVVMDSFRSHLYWDYKREQKSIFLKVVVLGQNPQVRSAEVLSFRPFRFREPEDVLMEIRSYEIDDSWFDGPKVTVSDLLDKIEEMQRPERDRYVAKKHKEKEHSRV